MARPDAAAKLAVAVAAAAVLLCCAGCAAVSMSHGKIQDIQDAARRIKGSCLSYGHACWGAHGKRSGSQHMLQPREQDSSNSRDLTKSRWFLSKLIQNPVEIRYFLENNVEGRRRDRDNFKKELNSDTVDKVQDDWGRIQTYANNDEDPFQDLGLNEEHTQDKVVHSKYLDKRSTGKL